MTSSVTRLAERSARRELIATGVFAAVAIGMGLLLALVPHRTYTPPIGYRPANAKLVMNWSVGRVHVRPDGGARTYGVALPGVSRAAGRTLKARALVRSLGAAGGRVCLTITATATTPAGDAHATTCRPLTSGWRKFDTGQLTTRAPSRVSASVEVTGNPGGFESRPITLN